MNRVFPAGMALLLCLGGRCAHAQLTLSDITNDGSTVTDFANAETVSTAPGSGIGYSAKNSGVFNHCGPAAATLTVNGAYNAHATPAAPGVDNFLGLNGGGASAVGIAGTTAPTFGILNLANGAAQPVSITNSAGINVGSSVAFSNGITTTIRSSAAAGAVRLLAGAAWSGTMGAARHVSGYVGKTGNTAFTYPVGDGSQYRPLSTTSNSGTVTANLAIAYVAGDPAAASADPTGGAHPRTSVNPAGTAGSTRIVSVSPVGFWDWVPVSGTGTVAFSVSIPAMSGVGGYPTGAELRVVGWNTGTGQWENLSGSTGAASNAAGTQLSGTAPDMSAYSAVGIGSVSSNPLPLGLLAFSAMRKTDDDVVLRWEVAHPADGLAYEVERSADAVRFAGIGTVAGTMEEAYSLHDYAPFVGASYYRLRVVERDGSVSYSNTARIYIARAAAVRVYPSPATDYLIVETSEPGVQVTLLDLGGKILLVQELANNVERFGISMLAPGTYILKVGDSYTVKVTKE